MAVLIVGSMLMDPEHFQRHLNLLGLEPRKPSAAALGELIQAQLARVPFENISKLYYKKRFDLKRLPDPERYLEGIEQFHFGGTCYTNNYYFCQLLAHLGYQVKLCGADMSNPDVHLVMMVTLEEREYLVDVGYGAPFLTPIPRDLPQAYVITLGRDRYVLQPQDAQGRSRLDLYRDSSLRHGYLAKPEPRQIQEFAQVIEDSFREEATFMNALLLARYLPNRAFVINNLQVIESCGTETSIRTLAGLDELMQAIYDYFAIPKEITAEAAQGMGRLGDAWS